MDSTQILINLEAKNLLAFRKKLLFQFCLQCCCPRSDWIGLFPWAKRALHSFHDAKPIQSERRPPGAVLMSRAVPANMFYMSCEKDDAKAERRCDFCCSNVFLKQHAGRLNALQKVFVMPDVQIVMQHITNHTVSVRRDFCCISAMYVCLLRVLCISRDWNHSLFAPVIF